MSDSVVGVEEKLNKLSDITEMLFVGALYNQPNLINDYPIKGSMFRKNGMGALYFSIFRKLVSDKGYEVVDRITIDNYINNQSKAIRAYYNKLGGFNTLDDFIQVSETSNSDQYYQDLLKVSSLRKLHQFGFDIEKQWDRYINISYKELSDTIENLVHKSFSEYDLGEDKVVDLKYGMDDMLLQIDSKKYTGLSTSSKCLNATINGLTLGDITLMAGMSGAGKTFLTITLLLPEIIKNNIPILIMCNEEDANKWRWNILIYIANNVISKKQGFQSLYVEKTRMFDGKLTDLEREQLLAAKEWYENHLQDRVIRFVSFNSFSMDKAIRLIKQYSTQYQVQYYIIDTFKLDNDIGSKVNDQSWLQLQQNMVKLYNVIKESSKNVHVWMTYQLNKTTRKYLDQTALGMSKNVADVASTVILARKVYENEKGDNKGRIIVKNNKGEEMNLNSDNDYMVLFIDKNRSGTTNNQIILKTDKGRNILRDVGFTKIMEDI